MEKAIEQETFFPLRMERYDPGNLQVKEDFGAKVIDQVMEGQK